MTSLCSEVSEGMWTRGCWEMGKPEQGTEGSLSPHRIPVICKSCGWVPLFCPSVLCGPCQTSGLCDLAGGEESCEGPCTVLLGRWGRSALGVSWGRAC